MDKETFLHDLAEFIVEANKNTWAGNGNEEEPERLGYKELAYIKDTTPIWRLRDSYAGYFRAPGMTTVYLGEHPVWTMAYGGRGMFEGCEGMAKPTFDFLKKALIQVDPDLPFRGPAFFRDGDFVYEFKLMAGDISDFWGEEQITNDSVRGLSAIFMQKVFGGIVIGKDKDRKPVYPWDIGTDLEKKLKGE